MQKKRILSRHTFLVLLFALLPLTVQGQQDSAQVRGGGLVGPIQPSIGPNFGDDRTDYCGNMIYENNALSQILFDGGYITLSGTTPTYHYYLQDHLGQQPCRGEAGRHGGTGEPLLPLRCPDG